MSHYKAELQTITITNTPAAAVAHIHTPPYKQHAGAATRYVRYNPVCKPLTVSANQVKSSSYHGEHVLHLSLSSPTTLLNSLQQTNK